MTEWDSKTYVAVERLLFDLDDVIKRCTAISTTPGCPRQTDIALTSAWQLLIDAARLMKEELDRLVLAKVDYDRELEESGGGAGIGPVQQPPQQGPQGFRHGSLPESRLPRKLDD